MSDKIKKMVNTLIILSNSSDVMMTSFIVKEGSGITRDQALFSFGFENYIPAGKAKRKESLIQTFNEMSAAHFFD